MKKIIRNGYLLNPKTQLKGYYDIVIENGEILEVLSQGTVIVSGNDEVIDATGLTVVPGFIDLHVHLREPGFEHKETIYTGTRACAKGGYTTVVCMPNTLPALDSVETIKQLKTIINRDAVIDVIPTGAITVGIKGESLTDHDALLKSGVAGLSDDGRTTMNAEYMVAAFIAANVYGKPVMTHSEDHVLTADYKESVFPIDSESNIVKRDIELCEATRGHLHVGHISGKDAIEMVREAKAKGIHVTCEAAPHHFALNNEMVDVLKPESKVNPPIREEKHRRAVIEGIKDGTIDVIATDHAPHDSASKSKGYGDSAFGISGIESAFSVTYKTLVLDESIAFERMVEMLTSKPAELAKLERVGSIEAGYKANITLLDLDKIVVIDKEQFISKGKNTPFHGKTYQGEVVQTLYQGDVVYNRL